MQVIRATHMGFCFGVRDALAATRDIDSPENVSVFGQLVHNQQVVQELVDRGFETIDESRRDDLPQRPMVMVTAHGISDLRRKHLLDSGKQLIDTTCPLVKRAHDAAKGLADRGYFVVVIGSPSHVEVRGIIEDLPAGNWAVVSTPDEVQQYNAASIGIIAQTTTPDDVAEACRQRIAEINPDTTIRWINTICRPTRQRQAAIDQLSRQVELVVVVGGANSNNTKRLVERCIENGVMARHVQSATDLRTEWFEGIERVGISAGTSTPDDIVSAVEDQIKVLANTRIPTNHVTELPKSSLGRNQWWIQYFRENLVSDAEIAWSQEPTLTPSEKLAVARSIAKFQLGESGEGKHIIACANGWSSSGGDPDYVTALKLFLSEEHQHSSWLKAFLLQEQVPLITKEWTNHCFKLIRHLAGLRTSISTLVTAEILAQVYYLALKRATRSETLIAICRRILRDEQKHVQFQQEQKYILSSHWSRFRKQLCNAQEWLFFEIVKRVLWYDHASVFAIAGMDWREFDRRTKRRWRSAIRIGKKQLSPKNARRELQVKKNATVPYTPSTVIAKVIGELL